MVKGRKFTLFCFGWYLLFLFPASNIMPISTKMADRYLYLSTPGFFLLFSFYLQKFLTYMQLKFFKSKAKANSKYNNHPKVITSATTKKKTPCNLRPYEEFRVKALFYLLPAVFVLILSILTVRQNIVWSNSVTLWTDTIKNDNRNFFALDKLASALTQKKRYAEASYYYSQSLIANPNGITTHINFGQALTTMGQPEKAIVLYNKGLKLWPNNIKLHNNLGNALGKTGNYKEAVKHLLFAVKKNPHYVEAHNNLGYYYGFSGNIKKGLMHCRKAIALNPRSAEAYNNLGMLYALQDNNKEAIKQYKKALEINPKLATVYYNIGGAFAMTGKLDNAIKSFQKAISLKPDYRKAEENYKKLLKLKQQNKVTVHEQEM